MHPCTPSLADIIHKHTYLVSRLNVLVGLLQRESTFLFRILDAHTLSQKPIRKPLCDTFNKCCAIS